MMNYPYEPRFGMTTEIIELETRILRVLAMAIHRYHLECDGSAKKEAWEAIEQLNHQTSIVKLDPKEHLSVTLMNRYENNGLWVASSDG